MVLLSPLSLDPFTLHRTCAVWQTMQGCMTAMRPTEQLLQTMQAGWSMKRPCIEICYAIWQTMQGPTTAMRPTELLLDVPPLAVGRGTGFQSVIELLETCCLDPVC